MCRSIHEMLKLGRNPPIEIFLQKYLDIWINPKSSDEIYELTKQLETIFNKNDLKEFYWEYSDDLQDLDDAHRFAWIWTYMHTILDFLEKSNFDLFQKFQNKYSVDYQSLISDSDLFD